MTVTMPIDHQEVKGEGGVYDGVLWTDEALEPHPDLTQTMVGLAVMEQRMLVVGRQMLADGSFGSYL
jgi:hypothetical protein